MMNKEEFIKQVYEDESQIPSGYLILKGVTGHEFVAKLKEWQEKETDTKVIWSKLAIIFDFEYIPTENINEHI